MATSRPGRPVSLQRERKRRRWPSLLAILAVAVTGCAQAGTGTGSASSSAAEVTVGPDDGGRTVDLQAGDRLIVRLYTGRRPPRFPPAWTLRMPPSKVLERVPGDPDAERVVLVAEAPGTVRLVLARRAGCSPPLRCPSADAADPAGQGARTRPPLAGVTVAITVHVR